MLHDLIDATVEQLTVEELARLDWALDVWERAGQISSAEAAAWRERITIWQRFRAGGQVRSAKPVVDIPLLDDPDPFLP